MGRQPSMGRQSPEGQKSLLSSELETVLASSTMGAHSGPYNYVQISNGQLVSAA
jgi:hypothetical protein